MSVFATIIIPTYNHGETIRYALRSALNQTVTDLEIFVIGDGVPEHQKPIIHDFVQSDKRVRFFDHPKHIRRGEPYRDLALNEATGTIVCYLCDRDLWLPDHVERMLHQLKFADFTHSLSLHVLPDQTFRFYPADLSQPEHFRFMRDTNNLVAFSCAAHTMDAYRRLPKGWETTPEPIQTDWFMFRKFLRMDGCRATSSRYPSSITFPSPPRKDWPIQQRIAELEIWNERISNPQSKDETVKEILEAAILFRDDSIGKLTGQLHSLRNSPFWKIRNKVIGIPGIKKLWKMVYKIFYRRSGY